MSDSASFQKVRQVISSEFSKLSASDKEALIDILRQGLESQIPFPSYSVTLDKNTVKQLIKDGNYDWVNDNVSDPHFPINKKGEEQTEIFIVSIDRRKSNAEVNRILDRWGLQDANSKEELSLGAQYPNLQRQGPIVFRGSTPSSPDGFPSDPY